MVNDEPSDSDTLAAGTKPPCPRPQSSVPFADWPAETLSEMRRAARDALDGLMEDGDPFAGGDWSLAAAMRHYIAITGGWERGELAAAQAVPSWTPEKPKAKAGAA